MAKFKPNELAWYVPPAPNEEIGQRGVIHKDKVECTVLGLYNDPAPSSMLLHPGPYYWVVIVGDPNTNTSDGAWSISECRLEKRKQQGDANEKTTWDEFKRAFPHWLPDMEKADG